LVTREITSGFEGQPNFQIISKSVNPPYNAKFSQGYLIGVARVSFGVLISMLFIFLWEIACLFYSKRQSLIFRFLNRHKYRIILPILITSGYFGYFAYFYQKTDSYQTLFVTSTQNASNKQLGREIIDFSDQIKSDEFFRGLVTRYDLFSEQRKQGVDEGILAQRLLRGTHIWVGDDNLEKGVTVSVGAFIRNEEPEKVDLITREIISRFEEQPNFQVVSKYISPPSDRTPTIGFFIFRTVVCGGIYAVLLIFIWQIPYLFYSQKTKEFVFEPLKADWQEELLTAESRNQTWKAIWINVRYSYAFLATMIQQSPIGKLYNFVNR
jgi:hypothetical protein